MGRDADLWSAALFCAQFFVICPTDECLLPTVGLHCSLQVAFSLSLFSAATMPMVTALAACMLGTVYEVVFRSLRPQTPKTFNIARAQGLPPFF